MQACLIPEYSEEQMESDGTKDQEDHQAKYHSQQHEEKD